MSEVVIPVATPLPTNLSELIIDCIRSAENSRAKWRYAADQFKLQFPTTAKFHSNKGAIEDAIIRGFNDVEQQAYFDFESTDIKVKYVRKILIKRKVYYSSKLFKLMFPETVDKLKEKQRGLVDAFEYANEKQTEISDAQLANSNNYLKTNGKTKSSDADVKLALNYLTETEAVDVDGDNDDEDYQEIKEDAVISAELLQTTEYLNGIVKIEKAYDCGSWNPDNEKELEKKLKDEEKMTKREEYDFVETPDVLTYSLIRCLIEKYGVESAHVIYEPACGHGRMVNCFEASGFKVIGSDIKVRESDADKFTVRNYITDNDPEYDVLITNPPYSFKRDFLKKAFASGKPFAMVLPSSVLASATCADVFMGECVDVGICLPNINFIKGNNRRFKASDSTVVLFANFAQCDSRWFNLYMNNDAIAPFIKDNKTRMKFISTCDFDIVEDGQEISDDKAKELMDMIKPKLGKSKKRAANSTK